MGYISQHKIKIIEGDLRCKELNNYLDSLNAEKCVWLSEDASGLVAKIEYDSETNQMVGVTLPLDSQTGFPVPFTFLARNENEIRENMNKEKSSLVYIIMAQPLIECAPPFLLQVFGTNNRFRSIDVLKRWKETVDILER